ncbi:RusA family crossover junction endodeoxyribonuclease [uncultured Acinetobacter sp.]|uniref:RusA family crossover junction endodeoxyribonuclease n=1 Tax=uncultured Acinetobacter sp. TaxID=165433 RepID=UPI0025895B68|nr:RusA family crossover junction endodeoxyribonuclease [uncultured Acinetobacter sp.]
MKNPNWKNLVINKGNIDGLEEEADKRTHRKARERRSTDVKTVVQCPITTQSMGLDRLHTCSNGGMVIQGEEYIAVKLPYGISTNDIWRLQTDSKGKPSVGLSDEAKYFKQRVYRMYAPILRALGWKPTNRPCEVRLIVQPPKKLQSYSASKYPRYDIDNYSKILIDSLKGIDLLFKDDNVFVQEKVQLAEPITGGCVWLSCVFIGETNWLDQKVDFDWLAGRQA